MKLLLDNNLSPQPIQMLSEQGRDVDQVRIRVRDLPL